METFLSTKITTATPTTITTTTIMPTTTTTITSTTNTTITTTTTTTPTTKHTQSALSQCTITATKDWWADSTYKNRTLWHHRTETWLDILDKHLLAEVSIQGYKVFSVDKPTPSKRGGGSIMYVKNSLNPIERKSMATRIMELILDINPKNTTHIKLVLVYQNKQ